MSIEGKMQKRGRCKEEEERPGDGDVDDGRTMAESGREGEVTELRLPTNATSPQRVLASRSATRSPHMIGG
jgi:hypothetical protein